MMLVKFLTIEKSKCKSLFDRFIYNIKFYDEK
jgi:hypothetical protein